jgi:hypothetical protein
VTCSMGASIYVIRTPTLLHTPDHRSKGSSKDLDQTKAQSRERTEANNSPAGDDEGKSRLPFPECARVCGAARQVKLGDHADIDRKRSS